MLKQFNISKMYYGFPIFVIGYKDESFKLNITTCSSSYSLGDMLIIGLFNESNAAKQIKLSKKFSLNILDHTKLDVIEYAGYNTGISKLINKDIPYETYDDLPILTDSQVCLIATVQQIFEQDCYLNFVCKIKTRLVNDKILNDNKFDYGAFRPMLYVGDTNKRVYRSINDEVIDSGSFNKKR